VAISTRGSLRELIERPSTLGGDALAEIDAAQSGLIGNVWQWDGDSWALIWPRVATAWDPGWWAFPALWIRAIRDGELTRP